MVGLRINPVDNKSNKKSDRMGNTHMYNSPRAGSVCELALWVAMMKMYAQKIGVFRGMVDFVASFDTAVKNICRVLQCLKEHLRQYMMNAQFSGVLTFF